MTIYSQKACVPCVTLKYWLDRKNIRDQFTELPINEHIDELRDLGFMAAPVVEINGKYYNGSNISSVADALRQVGLLIDEQSIAIA